MHPTEPTVAPGEVPTHDGLKPFLEISSARHRHLCPRQVLGVRIGLAGAAALGTDIPRKDKRLLVIVETDGCFVSGVEVTAGVGVHRRTLRVVDYGKIAATFVEVASGRALRVAPRAGIREAALAYAPASETRRYYGMLHGYQAMPDGELLAIQEVRLTPSIETLVSRAGVRAACDRCGEEIINEREVSSGGQTLCRSCVGDSYYRLP